MALHHVAASSWNGIRTVQDILYESHALAARQLGLVNDSEHYFLAFEEAIPFFSTPRELRQLLVTLIIAGAPATSFIFQTPY